MVFYKYVSAKRVDILQKRLIRFTHPNAMNDPFEAKPDFDAIDNESLARVFGEIIIKAPYFLWEKIKKLTRTKLDRWAFAKQLRENPDCMEQLYSQEAVSKLLDNLRESFYALHNTVGVLSLSETPNNLLMWAHYAAGHTGFVLALDGSSDFFKKDGALLGCAKPEPVEYKLKRPRIKIEEISQEPVLRDIFFVKSLDWKYEKEWRYLKFLNEANKQLGDDMHLFRLPPKCIMSVILGCYSTKELQNKILELQRNDPDLGHLKIEKAHVSQTHYRLNIGEIETKSGSHS